MKYCCWEITICSISAHFGPFGEIKLPMQTDSGTPTPTEVADLPIPRKEECVYTHCYCEENIWKLSKAISDRQTQQDSVSQKDFIVFISNASKTIPIFQPDGGHVVWVLISHEMKEMMRYAGLPRDTRSKTEREHCI
jgi:hypothetical protein